MSKKNKSTFGKFMSSFGNMFKRLFVKDKVEKDLLAEEAIMTPAKVILKNLVSNKLAVIGFIGFVAIFCFSFIGSQIKPLSLNYTELTNANLRPGRNYLKYPKELDSKDVKEIVSGISFSAAITEDGKFYIWGTESNRELENVSTKIFNVPAEVYENKIVDIVAGGTHILAIDENDNVYGWGYYGNNQTIVPDNVKKVFEDPNVSIKKVLAATQWTAILGTNGELYIWGSSQAQMNFLISSKTQGRIVDVVAGDNNMALLLDDGTMTMIGDRGTEFYLNIPENVKNGEVKIKQMAATNRNVLLLTEEGDLILWGSAENQLNVMPEYEGDIVAIASGYKNFLALQDNGEVVVWGSTELGQNVLPEDADDLTEIYGGYFQFYGEDSEGVLHAWGNKGYFFGSDHFGRDIYTRIIHGGRISLTVGAIAMVISTIIAIIVGLTAGYFGGWVDQALMRLADVFSAIPFFPIAVTLSFIMGNKVSQSNRLFIIMIILGVLGWMGLARLIRAQLLLEREKDFVLAARALGVKQRNIMSKHILPNVFNMVLVNITLGYASSLLTEAGLSFLGFGVSEPTPSWGNMLNAAEQATVIEFYWWRWVIPAVFVIAAALCINLIGDALRDAMDPKANER